jgi:hypothetical protein
MKFFPRTKIVIFFSSCIFGLLLILPAGAVELIPRECISGGGQQCGVCQFIQVGINFTQILLGMMGGLALVMFVYGGLLWVTSGGSADRIKKGRTLMVQTVIGIIIMLLAWSIINVVIITLTGTDTGGINKVGVVRTVIGPGQAWSDYCKNNK